MCRPANLFGIIFILLQLFSIFADCRQILAHSEKWYRQPGNPGVRIRLTKKGINHLKTVGVDLLNEQIRNIKGYSSHYPFNQAGLTGHVDMYNVKVLKYHPPQLSVVNFLPPKYIVLGLEQMDIQLAGNFDGSAPPFKVGGSVDGYLKGMTVALTAEFAKSEDGLMNVHVANCSTVIEHAHFNIHPVGPSSGMVRAFETQINDGIRRRIPNMFCRKLKTLIEENSPKLFARLAKTTLGESFQSPVTDNTVIKKFVADFVDGLYIDNRNIDNPIVTNDFFETQMKGEVRYEDSDYSTPFYPRPMVTPINSDRMLYFYGSEYLFNSLLFHAYQKNKLNLELNQTNLPQKYRSFLSTSCAKTATDFISAICVGNLVPAIGRQFPNSSASFVLLPHGLPDFSFNGDAGAIQLSTRILTYVDEHGLQRQVMVSSADGQCDIHLYAHNGRLSGNLTVNSLNVRLHRASISGINPKNIEEFSPIARTFIAPQISEALKKGMPFPIKDQLDFIAPTLRIDDGYIELATDFNLNRAALRKKVVEAFRNTKI